MKLAYERKESGVVIRRCYDYGSEAELPEQIEGRPVTELAPYAFSVHMEEGALERDIRQGRLREENKSTYLFGIKRRDKKEESRMARRIGQRQ